MCYTEMTQVEERYSMTDVSKVSPIALLLLCGDEPLDLQGSGPDVSVSLVNGCEFLMPREQANAIQDLRYALRQAFIGYCHAPLEYRDHIACLDSAAALLQASMDETGKPLMPSASYQPSVPARVPQTTSRASLPAKGTPSLAASSCARAPQPLQTLPEGQELTSLHALVQSIYGPGPQGRSPLDWTYTKVGALWKVSLRLVQDQSGMVFDGETAPDRKAAQRATARAAWVFMTSEADEAANGEIDENANEEPQEAAVQEDEGVDMWGGEAEVEEDEVQVVDDEEQWNAEEEREEENEEEDDARCQEAFAGADGGSCDVDLEGTLDEDQATSAALRFMMGDVDYLDLAGNEVDEEPYNAPAAKRQRLD
eukprot:NODE_11549_length_1279_cov_4.267361.p1 GENE.NODE_11549_length_1279_cov_4.267361~~NODE_11549_length_1279_cov_4.267361.p1  ORF type:complete len:380 (-),score=75.63 NODE_11549_length_1279_cov_4.267361:140-1243(-)